MPVFKKLISNSSTEGLVAIVGTVLIWTFFDYIYPSEPLNVGETSVVLVGLFVFAKGGGLLVRRLRSSSRSPSE